MDLSIVKQPKFQSTTTSSQLLNNGTRVGVKSIFVGLKIQERVDHTGKNKTPHDTESHEPVAVVLESRAA
jgi:hypothetical protein